MLGLRRVSFHIAFMGLGLRIRASAERWCDRSTDADILEEDARDIEVRGGRSAKVVSLGTRRLVEMLSLRTERGGARKAIRRGRVRQWRSVRAVAAHTALYIARARKGVRGTRVPQRHGSMRGCGPAKPGDGITRRMRLWARESWTRWRAAGAGRQAGGQAPAANGGEQGGRGAWCGVRVGAL